MISKSQIKLIQSLKQIKFRREYGLFVAEGRKIVEEILSSGIKVKDVYALSEWIEEKKELTNKARIEAIQVNQKDLERISNLSTPNQVLAVCRIPRLEADEIEEGGVQLALDGIRDPGNLGTIIRIADWFGVKDIICSDDCVDVYNPKVIQATMGSITRVKVTYTNLADFLERSRQNIYATVLDSESIFDTRPGEGIYIIGNESMGIRKEVLQHATHRVSIPSYGKAESLNASVAAGIVLAVVSNK